MTLMYGHPQSRHCTRRFYDEHTLTFTSLILRMDLRGVAGGDGELGCLCEASVMWVIIAPPIHLGAWSMAVAAILYYCLCVCTGSKMTQLCVKLKASITTLLQSWSILGFFPQVVHIPPADLNMQNKHTVKLLFLRESIII